MRWIFWRSWMKKTRKVPKEGLSIICSTKKNTTICWNKGSISPYNKKHHSTCRLWQMCRIFRSQSSPSGTDLRIRCFHIRSRSTVHICQNRRHTADYRIRFCKEYQSNHKNHLAYLALYEKYRKLGNFTENELFHR